MTIEIIQTILPLLFTEQDEEQPDDYSEEQALWDERLKKELRECEMICGRAGIRTGKVTAIRINPRGRRRCC